MSIGPVVAYRFDRFILNIERGCLQSAGADLELRPKAFVLLLYLVRHAGKLASKDELVSIVWPDVCVSDDSLAQCVREVRHLLGDETQRFIRTVPRRGYIFVAEVSPIGPDDLASMTGAVASAGTRLGRHWLRFAAAGLIIPVLAFGAWAAVGGRSEGPEAGLLLVSGETVIGQRISYPEGEAEVTAAIVVLEPGQESRWHSHQAPLFAYVLEGEFTIDYGSEGVRIFRAGEGLLEATELVHSASNHGSSTARALVVHMGAEGLAPVIEHASGH